MAYGDFKNLTRRTASDNILHDEAFNTAKNLMMGIKGVLHFVIKILHVELLKMKICQIKN